MRRAAGVRAGLAMSVLATSVLALALLALAGCAGPQPVRGEMHYAIDTLAQAQRPVWPPAPEPARFLFAGTLTGEKNFRRPGGDTSALRSFGRWLVGLDENADKPVVLQRPAAVIGDDRGRVYVSDTSRQAVFVFDEKLGELQLWDQAAGVLRFVAPSGLALGADGELLVADAELGFVARLDAQGQPLGVIGKGQLQRPTGLARDAASGRLYVADTYAHDIKVFDRAGVLLHRIGQRGAGAGEFNFPTHLALFRGELYVTDTLNSRVQVLRVDADGAGPAAHAGAAGATGVAPRQFGSRGLVLGNLVRPKGVALDSQGHVYVVESYHDSLLVFSNEGEFLLPIGGTGLAAGQFYLPSGVWVDARDRVYVADMFNGRIVLFQFLGSG